MKTEEQIKDAIKIAEKRADMAYENGDFQQQNNWLNFADGLKYVLEIEG